MKSIKWIMGAVLLLAGMTPAQVKSTETKPSTRPAVMPRTTTSRISEVMGRELKNSQGDSLGRVQELVLDDETGRVAYVVVSSSGEGAEERLWVVPWDVLSPAPVTAASGDKVERTYVVDLDRG